MNSTEFYLWLNGYLEALESEGIEVCKIKNIREKGIDTPTIFLTALNDIDNRIQGFDAGGDDYLSKPFEPKELLLRVKNILNKTKKSLDAN